LKENSGHENEIPKTDQNGSKRKQNNKKRV
jgi:hypothetical protein